MRLRVANMRIISRGVGVCIVTSTTCWHRSIGSRGRGRRCGRSIGGCLLAFGLLVAQGGQHALDPVPLPLCLRRTAVIPDAAQELPEHAPHARQGEALHMQALQSQATAVCCSPLVGPVHHLGESWKSGRPSYCAVFTKRQAALLSGDPLVLRAG